MEVAGHNLANVNNPAYSRQRVNISTSVAISTPVGHIGTGSQVVSIQQIRSGIVDSRLQTSTSVTGYLEGQQQALQYAEAVLGQEIDSQSTGAEGAAASQGVGGQHGIAERLSDLFSSFHNISTLPTSLSERQAALIKAKDLADQFKQIDSDLEKLNSSLDDSINDDVGTANELLDAIARYNKEIFLTEIGPGKANDLRDLRQQKIEQLAHLVEIQTSQNSNGTVNVSAGGQALVTGVERVDTLETYDAGGGQLLLRTQTGGAPLSLSSGQIQGTIAARDGAITDLRSDVNRLATSLISEVNNLHRTGFSLSGATGADFFVGTDATNIAVNPALLNDPTLFQASGVAGAVGDNKVALALAQLANKAQGGLANQTFNQSYGQTVAAFGQSLSSVTTQLTDQGIVDQLLQRQRDSISGVSIDEEMTDLIKFQRAFEASARIITTVDEMLRTVISM
jgi:flagellar hook-associated protein 1 FlgK